VWSIISDEVARLGATLLALGGMSEHVHILVRLPGKLSASEIARQAKGVSSHAVNALLPAGASFRWQEGYGAFSVSRSHLARVQAYVEDQEERHRSGRLWPEWEETDELAPPAQ
jgi:putative transposase